MATLDFFIQVLFLLVLFSAGMALYIAVAKMLNLLDSHFERFQGKLDVIVALMSQERDERRGGGI